MKIAIVGGGLTGTIAALDLADRGQDVVIFDSGAGLLTRASTANEGKVHLGYVYGADTSFGTAARMIDDALMFRPILERTMGAKEFDACLFDTFRYIVPANSSLSQDHIRAHFGKVETRIRDRKKALGLGYLGEAETPEFQVLDGGVDGICIDSHEKGVWPTGIADALRCAAAAHPRIDIRTRSRVIQVTPKGEKWQICLDGGVSDGPFDIVVNAAWADRRNIDRRSGHGCPETWFTRFKFGVLLEGAHAIFGGAMPRNGTGTSGSFGDSVYYPQDDTLYCSWYPVGMCFSTAGEFRDGWPDSESTPEELMQATWRGYASIDPAYDRLLAYDGPRQARLIGDYIVAKGASDIDDPKSGLHQRSDHAPVELARGYWTVETGKYTSAPRVADQTVQAILA